MQIEQREAIQIAFGGVARENEKKNATMQKKVKNIVSNAKSR